jgi:hypothetical protein
MDFRRALLIALFVPFFGGSVGNAKDDMAGDASLLDHPVSVQRVSAKSASGSGGELRCSFYKDLMVREAGTDTPAPGGAELFLTAGQTPALCSVDPSPAGELTMKTAGYSFIGRKGSFLFFRHANPNGSVPFMIADAVDGRVIYNDSKLGDGFQSISLTKHSVHLRYIRGVNGSCSLYKEGPACWAKMMNEGKVPRVMAQAQPSVQLCGANYRRLNTSADAASIVYYDVDVTLGRDGKAHVNSRGPTNCTPLP